MEEPRYITFGTIKLRILDIFRQSWYSNINNSSRRSTYSLYKHDFEEYLKHVNTFIYMYVCFTPNKDNVMLYKYGRQIASL